MEGGEPGGDVGTDIGGDLGHVVLVGLMGTGKTTVGRIVARRLGRRFVDSDALIEARTGRTVREIFARDGEPAFRALETEALLDALAAREPRVVAAAGGAVLSRTNRQALQEMSGVVVWLHADIDLLTARAVRGAHRPLLDDDPEGTLRRMAIAREPLYRDVADIVVATSAGPPADVADRILAILDARGRS